MTITLDERIKIKKTVTMNSIDGSERQKYGFQV